MKSGTLLLTALAALSVTVSSLVVNKRDGLKVVSFHIEKIVKAPISTSPTKRQNTPGTVKVIDENYMRSVLYLIELQLGTPPQTVKAQFDTGSPNLVQHSVRDNLCLAAPPNPCSKYGGYNANASSTYKYLDSNFQVVYADGDRATGDGVTDTCAVGGAAVTGLYIGVQYQTTTSESVVGVLFTEDERNDDNTGHANLPLLLRDQGFTASRAYSLWTNDDRAAGGEVIFGGIDTAKYIGNLVTLNLLPDLTTNPVRVTDFDVPLDGITGTGRDGSTMETTFSSTRFSTNLDSGTTLAQVPSAVAQSVWNYVGATAYSDNPTIASIPCSVANSGIVISFLFPGITIKVPISQLIIQPDEDGNCLFGINKGDGASLLGDVFLSSAYVVYDLDNKQVSLAQAVVNTAASNVVPIAAGPNGVPRIPGGGVQPTGQPTTTATTSATTSATTTATTSATTTRAVGCSRDNCFRNLLDARYRVSASAFCSTYTTATMTEATAIPTYLRNCRGDTKRVSSACTCLKAEPTA